ncbi:MAG TPA: hypothetical protein DCM45_07440 [Clostridiales bacterium]|nr:hypothetical protein [Clostridiales bacterium]
MTRLFRQATSIQMKMTVEAMKMMSAQSGLVFSASPMGGKIDYQSVRSTMDAGYANFPIARGVAFADLNICPVHLELISPDTLRSNNIILYIHGGGFVCGSAKGSRGIASYLAAETGCRVVTVDYRLAPENPFPAGVDDCYTVYKALLANYPGSKIALAGESAGATASLVTTLRAMRDQVKLPAAVVLHSPVVTVADINRKDLDTEDIIIGKDVDQALKGLLFDEATDLQNPDLSPIYGDYHGFPPIFLTSDARETLSTDAQLLYDKVIASGAEITWIVVEGTFHAFGATGRGTPETAQILDESESFILKHFE